MAASGGRLRELDLTGNSLTHLPEDMSYLRSLEVLNLSHNNFCSQTSVFNPNKFFISFSSIQGLKVLNLSHNQLTGLHLDELLLKPQQQYIFRTLLELDMSFNQVAHAEDLSQAVHFRHMGILNIVGNPLLIEAQRNKNKKQIRPRP